MRIDIVVPCYNEEAVLPDSARRLIDLLSSMTAAGQVAGGSRILFVDDGSCDDTWRLIRTLAAADPRVAGIRLSRNMGHQVALLAGLLESRADAAISIDADLQDNIGAMPTMVEHCRAGCDIVYGVRAKRDGDTVFKRLTAGLFYRAMNRIGVALVPHHGDFRLLSRRALDCLAEYRETNLFLRGLVTQLGFRTATVDYERSARRAGESKYPLRRMLALALDGVTSFSAAPLRATTAVGALAVLASVFMTAWVLWIRFGTDSAVPGWASTVIPMYFLGGMQLLCIGVVGEYLARVYLEVKHRPRYFIDERIGQGQGG
ncbi:MAG: glycosyltransferase family 2 protein [Gammaproteobacteria bacterium]|nr:glycosyltransferase family 2 protein [Gammaproteobacteria bacterium]